MNVTTDEATRQIITGMAESLHTTAQQAFNLYVQGVRIEALGDLVSVIIVMVMGLYTAKKAYKWCEKEKPERNHRTADSMMWAVTAGALVAALLIVPVDIVVTSLQKVIIPEYYVMKDVLETASQVVK